MVRLRKLLAILNFLATRLHCVVIITACVDQMSRSRELQHIPRRQHKHPHNLQHHCRRFNHLQHLHPVILQGAKLRALHWFPPAPLTRRNIFLSLEMMSFTEQPHTATRRSCCRVRSSRVSRFRNVSAPLFVMDGMCCSLFRVHRVATRRNKLREVASSTRRARRARLRDLSKTSVMAIVGKGKSVHR